MNQTSRNFSDKAQLKLLYKQLGEEYEKIKPYSAANMPIPTKHLEALDNILKSIVALEQK